LRGLLRSIAFGQKSDKRSGSAPLNLEGVLWELELTKRLTVSQILLRRELRRMTPEDRRSLIREIADFTIECPVIPNRA